MKHTNSRIANLVLVGAGIIFVINYLVLVALQIQPKPTTKRTLPVITYDYVEGYSIEKIHPDSPNIGVVFMRNDTGHYPILINGLSENQVIRLYNHGKPLP